MLLAVSAAGFGKIATRRSALRRASTVFHAGIVLVAVAAAGVGLALAAVTLARGAEALGGIGKREGSEEEKRGQRRGHAAAEWGDAGAEDLRNENGHALRVLSEKWPGKLDGERRALWRAKALFRYFGVIGGAMCCRVIGW